jgi:hypothetical protein
MELFSQIILSVLTGLGGIAAGYIRSMSKDVKIVSESIKDINHQLKMSVQELRMDLDHIDEKVCDLKIKVEKGDTHVRNQRNARPN